MRVGIVVGCSSYTDPGIGNLNFANEDAVNFSSMLKHYCGFDEKNIRVLMSPAEPDRLAIRNNMIRELLPPKKRLPIEVLVIFFSGHGIRSARDGKDYVLLEDTQFDALEETAISFEYINSQARAWSAKCTLLFFDACRNVVRGGKSLNDSEDQPFHPAQLNYPGSAAFFSCARNERSYEIPELGSGLFTYALIEALGEVGRCRTVRDVSKYLGKRVPLLGAQYQRQAQTPYSIIEPIEVSNVILVSMERSLTLDSSVPVGKEIRHRTSRDSTLSVRKDSLLAVDFGTTYSLAAFTTDDGTMQYLDMSDGNRTLPSIISFYPDFSYVVGKDMGNVSTADGQCQVVRNFKRLLASNGRVDVLGRDIPAITLASMLIGSIRKNYEEATGQPVFAAIAAVPANFGMGATNTLAHAFYLAGIPLTRIIGEPCAAALNMVGRNDLVPPPPRASTRSDRRLLEESEYAADWDEPRADVTLLVVDVGGGTTDVSVVEIARVDDEWQFEVLAVHGDNFLGGMDYDQVVIELICQRVRAEFSEEYVKRWMSRPAEWLSRAEQAKVQFSHSETVFISLPPIEDAAGLTDAGLALDRSEFIDVASDLSGRLKACINRLAECWDGRKGPDYILLAGQGCKIHPVRIVVEEFANGIPIIDSYQENAVIAGLLKQTEVLSGLRKDMLLLDAIYTGLSVACNEVILSRTYVDSRGNTHTRVPELGVANGTNENNEKFQILEAFTTIPTMCRVVFHISDVVNTALPLHLYEEFSHGEQSTILGSMIIPPGTQGSLEMGCDIDADGVIRVHLFKMGMWNMARGKPKACIAAYIVNRQWTSAVSGLLEQGYEPLPWLAP